MPFFKIRTSKFRHVYGSVARKDKCYENIKITKNAHDSNFCSVNPKFIAVVTETAGGGSFLVLPLNKTGRIEVNMPKVTGHRGNVLDIKWNPFDDNVIASCSDDTTIKVWYIPDGGLFENITQCLVNLRGHQRRIGFIEWHPTANNILASAGYDYKAIIWNVETGEAVTYIQCHTDTIYNLSFNRDGSLLATTCKDKKLRLIDPRTGELLSETPGHQGTKSSKVTFLGDTDRLATCGFSRMCERQFGVWDVRDLSKPLRMENIDSGSGTLLPYYDQDTKVVFIAGKGDGNIRYYEIVPEAPYFHYLSEYKSSSPQRGLGVMPKRGLDVSRCEIMRFYKLHSVAGIVEPVAMIVPRKSDMFQDDLYPDTVAPEPALTAKEWISGINREPLMMSLRENNNIFTPPRYHQGVVNRNGIDHNVGNNEIDGNLDNFKPIVDAGYYQSGSKKSPQQQSQPAPAPPQLVYQSPPQKSEADSGYYRSTRSREEEELNEAPQNRKKKQEWKPVTLNLEKHENEVPAYQRGHRQQEDVKQKSPEREKVKIFEHVTEHLKVETQQTPQQTIEEQKPKAHVERFKTRPTRDHVQEHTETKSKPQERKHHKTSPKQKKPRESPERFRRRTKELVEDEDKDKEDIFFTPPENPDKVISVHERKRSFEPSKPREERTDEFRRRTKSEDISRSEVHQVHSADGRKVEVLEGSSRPTVIIVSQKEDVTNIESESVPESATQVTTAIPDEDEGEEYGSGSFVSRTRSSLISKFTGQSSNSTTSPPSVRKIESDVMNMDQLRKAYLKQQDEIRRLKAEVKRRDYRISQLEAEISDLQR